MHSYPRDIGAMWPEMRGPGKKIGENVDNKQSGLFETRVLMRIRSQASFCLPDFLQAWIRINVEL